MLCTRNKELAVIIVLIWCSHNTGEREDVKMVMTSNGIKTNVIISCSIIGHSLRNNVSKCLL